VTAFSPSGAAAHSKLPSNPSLGLLSNLARQLRKSHAAHESGVMTRLKSSHPRFKNATDDQVRKATLTLRDAQLVIAREHGFENWAALKKHVLSLNAAAAPEAALKSLMEAADRGELARVRALLDEHPTLIDARGGENSQTALHHAACNGHRDLVELLLERGADPAIRDVGDNATALHFAAEKGDLHIVKLLIEHGADPDGFGDVHGVDVIGWATCFGGLHREVAEYLLQQGAQHNIFSAVAMGDVQAIKALARISRDVMDKPMAIW